MNNTSQIDKLQKYEMWRRLAGRLAGSAGNLPNEPEPDGRQTLAELSRAHMKRVEDALRVLTGE
jgi:hypothetical protein